MSNPLWDAIQNLPPFEGRESTPEELIEMALLEDAEIVFTEPGEVTHDVDGIPSGIHQPTTSEGTLGKICLTADEWESIARHLIEKEREK